MRLFEKVAIIGVGLIGGSMGLGIRRKGLSREIIGVTRHRSSLVLAKKRGIIDRGFLEVSSAVKDADLIILSTPVREIINLFSKISPLLKEGAIVTDVGSTKTLIVKRAESILNKRNPFIGGHPLTGSEKGGVEEAREDLFWDSLCILTITSQTNPQALKRVSQLWKELGAKVKLMDPHKHDSIIAKVSHLPHAIAVALILSLEKKIVSFGAGGLRDTTRIASSNPLLWQDIFFTNREQILQAMEDFEKIFGNLKSTLRRKEEKKFLLFLNKAKRVRGLLEK